MAGSVTLLSGDDRLATDLLALLGDERRLALITSPLELTEGASSADVIVVDVPAGDRRAACEQIRRHHRGQLIVLLDQEDNSRDLPPDYNRTLLTRPFWIHELSVALAASAPLPPTSDPADQPRRVLPTRTRARSASPGLGLGPGVAGQRVLQLLQSRWDRRRLRVAALIAALLLTGASALVAKDEPCGPACDNSSVVDRTSLPSTTASAVVAAPDMTESELETAGPPSTRRSAGPTVGGQSRVDAAPGGMLRITTTTAESSGAPRPTLSPSPTRPPPTAPPTTGSTTTTAEISTSTTTTATTIGP